MSYGNTTHRVGSIGVDSGQVMVGDPCYLGDWKDTDSFAMDLKPESCVAPFEYSYEGACQATCGDDHAGELGRQTAVAVSSGYGDGCYPVYVEKNHEGRVVALHVYFDEDPNEDSDCSECGGGNCGPECDYATDDEDDEDCERDHLQPCEDC